MSNFYYNQGRSNGDSYKGRQNNTPTTSYGAQEAYGRFWNQEAPLPPPKQQPKQQHKQTKSMDPMDEVLSSSDDEIPPPPLKRPATSGDNPPKAEGPRKYARMSNDSDDESTVLNYFGVVILNIPSHINEESLKLMADYQGYSPAKVKIIGTKDNTRDATAYFVNNSDALQWIQLNQGTLKFSHGQSAEMVILPKKNPNQQQQGNAAAKGTKTGLLAAPGMGSQAQQYQFFQNPTPSQYSSYPSQPKFNELMSQIKDPNDKQWLAGIMNTVAGSQGDDLAPSGEQKWTCYKCMSENHIAKLTCFKCTSTKRESEELEAKGSQYVGLGACDTLLVRDLPHSVDEMVIRMSIMQYMDVVPSNIHISESRKYCFIQCKTTDEAMALLDKFNRVETPLINNSPVVITFSKRSLKLVLADRLVDKSTRKSTEASPKAGLLETPMHQSSAQPRYESWLNEPVKKPHSWTTPVHQPPRTESWLNEPVTKPSNFYNGPRPISGQAVKDPSTIETPFGTFKIYAKPNPDSFQYEPTSGYYFDAGTGFYFDKTTGYYYNVDKNEWMFWSDRYTTYIPCEGGDLEGKKRLQEEEKMGIIQPTRQKKTLLGSAPEMGIPKVDFGKSPNKILEEARMKDPRTYALIRNLVEENQKIKHVLEVAKEPRKTLLQTPNFPPPPPDRSKDSLPKEHELWLLNGYLTMAENDHKDILIKLRTENPQLDETSNLANVYLENEMHGIRKYLNNIFKFAIRCLPEKLAEDDKSGNGFDPGLYDAGKSKKLAALLQVCHNCFQKGHAVQKCWAQYMCIKCAQFGHHSGECKAPQKAKRDELIKQVLAHKKLVFNERLKKAKSAIAHLQKSLGINSSAQEEVDIQEITKTANEMLGNPSSLPENAQTNCGPDSWRGFKQRVYNGPTNLDELNRIKSGGDGQEAARPSSTIPASSGELPDPPRDSSWVSKPAKTEPGPRASLLEVPVSRAPDSRIIDVNELMNSRQTPSIPSTPSAPIIAPVMIPPTMTVPMVTQPMAPVAPVDNRAALAALGPLLQAPQQQNQGQSLEEMELALVQQQLMMLEREKSQRTVEESWRAPPKIDRDTPNFSSPIHHEPAQVQRESARIVREPRPGQKAEVVRESVSRERSMPTEPAEKAEVVREKFVVTKEMKREALDVDMRSEDDDLRSQENPEDGAKNPEQQEETSKEAEKVQNGTVNQEKTETASSVQSSVSESDEGDSNEKAQEEPTKNEDA